MRKFAELLARLFFTYSHKEKEAILKQYFQNTSDPDRGYALAILAGTLKLDYFKRSWIREVLIERIDPVLLGLSFDYVGDLSETASLLWPVDSIKQRELPSLSEVIFGLQNPNKASAKVYFQQLMDAATVDERWALLKINAGELRIGVSARFMKHVLAALGEKNVQEIEEIWHAVTPPYEQLFAWLEEREPKPDVTQTIYFHPVMLAQPLEEKKLIALEPEEYGVEWKYDGIRVQVISSASGKALFSRTGDDISHSFPDIFSETSFHAVLDGELVVRKDDIGSFNELQQRLNRKKPSDALMQEYPGHIILYDALMINGEDLRQHPFKIRRGKLQTWFESMQLENFSLSPQLVAQSRVELIALRDRVVDKPHPAIEGLMLKRLDSIYVSGRPAGQWYKWKRDPFLLDAVLMYAQRGHGKRSSFYSDYTFGLWKDGQLLPIGKAYFGFTDEELRELDRWVRNHTIQKFGPVCEVEKALVFEVAFEGVQRSKRHKSGFALRFPRINRIRWDKPADEADEMDALARLVSSQ